jgi:hypothetical protein
VSKQVEHFTREAGAGYSQSVEDPAMRLLGDPVPEWVELPRELGSGRRNVTGHREITCPCGQHRTRELQLGPGLNVETNDVTTLCVAECSGDGFIWYERKGLK